MRRRRLLAAAARLVNYRAMAAAAETGRYKIRPLEVAKAHLAGGEVWWG